MATLVAPIDNSLARAVALAGAGEEAAFDRIIKAHHDDMTRVCFVICGDLDVANEAVQAAWPIVWRKLGSLRDHLPDGTSITWSGTGTSITRSRTDGNGVTTIGNSTHANGVATDQAGNAYAFNYSNEFRISNTVADPTVFSGLMTDSFSLAGQGPARLSNGFVAVFTTDFVSYGSEPLISRGDPISFAPFPEGFTPHCDPLQ